MIIYQRNKHALSVGFDGMFGNGKHKKKEKEIRENIIQVIG